MPSRIVRALLIGSFVLSIQSGCHSLTRSNTDRLIDSEKDDSSKKLELPPDEAAKACLAAAQMLDKNGKNREAIALYEKARASDPGLEHVCRRLAVLHDREADFVKADEEYARAMKLYPRDANLYNDMGYSQYARNNFKQAEELYRKALELKPDNKRAIINLGMTLAMLKRYPESLETFQKALPEAQAHCNIAFAMMAQGQLPEAKAHYRKALELAPDLQMAEIALAKLETNAKQPVSILDRPTESRKPAPEKQSLPAEKFPAIDE